MSTLHYPLPGDSPVACFEYPQPGVESFWRLVPPLTAEPLGLLTAEVRALGGWGLFTVYVEHRMPSGLVLYRGELQESLLSALLRARALVESRLSPATYEQSTLWHVAQGRFEGSWKFDVGGAL